MKRYIALCAMLLAALFASPADAGRPTPPAEIFAASAQADDLLAWLPFGAGDLLDLSGNGHNADFDNADREVDAYFGSVGSFNGTSQYIRLASPIILPRDWSFACWIKVASFSDTDSRRILATGRDASNKFSYFFDTAATTGTAAHSGRRFRAVLTPGAGLFHRHMYNGPAHPFEYSTGEWHHWVCTRNGSVGTNNTVNYVNGELVTAHNIGTDAAVTTTFDGSGMSTFVGANVNSDGETIERFGAFQIADIRLYGVQLDADQAAALYAPGTRWDLYGQPAFAGLAGGHYRPIAGSYPAITSDRGSHVGGATVATNHGKHYGGN